MRRLRITTKIRLDLFLDARGRCRSCNSRIAPGQFWDVDHIIPVALGGSNDTANLQVLCRACHRQKTASGDVPRIAKSKRQRAMYLGAKRSAVVIPGSRRSPWKRKLDGTVIRRRD